MQRLAVRVQPTSKRLLQFHQNIAASSQIHLTPTNPAMISQIQATPRTPGTSTIRRKNVGGPRECFASSDQSRQAGLLRGINCRSAGLTRQSRQWPSGFRYFDHHSIASIDSRTRSWLDTHNRPIRWHRHVLVLGGRGSKLNVCEPQSLQLVLGNLRVRPCQVGNCDWAGRNRGGYYSVELPGIEPVSGCWSLSRAGTELRNDTGRDSPEFTSEDTECAQKVPSQYVD